MTPEQLADKILRAAGSKLAHYDPVSKERIIEAAREGMDLPEKPAGWLSWEPGECPVPLDSRPGVLFRDGILWEPGEGNAAGWIGEEGNLWKHEGERDDNIIAYMPDASYKDTTNDPTTYPFDPYND
jgi:hypothetical protein